jgi:transcriptional regulator with XRE-family HTH domain
VNTSANKLPEIKKEVFKKAREALGLSAKELSGMACLSVRQIEQIENGESSSFYGAQIKVTAAKKVAGLLKLNEADAFDFIGVAPAKKINPENISEKTKSDDTKPIKAKAPEKKIELQKPITPPEQKPASPKEKINDAAESNPKKKIIWIFGVAAVLVFSIVSLRPLFFPEAEREEVVVIQEAPASPPPEAVADAKPAIPATPESAAAPLVAAAPAVPSECPPVDSAVVNYKADAPKKAGDMVYLQSKTAQTICVLDANGKMQNKTLEPGVGASIYGKPPLKVLTSGQAQVDMYYQGVKVRLSNNTAKTIVLEQAELIQPTVSTDSQLR